MDKKRFSFIDIAKAFAILFIVFGHIIVHSVHCSIVFKFLYSFHVVLFFILSGYTFKTSSSDTFSEFIKKKFFRIMIPYFVWSLIFLIPYMIFGSDIGKNLGTSGSFDLQTQLLNILYGNGNLSALKQNSSLWFLPALFSMEVLYYFVLKKSKSLKIDILLLFVSIILGFFTATFLNFILPWGINTALNLGSFFLIGYFCEKYNIFNKSKLFKLSYILIIMLIGGLAFYYNSCVQCIDYFYGNFVLTFLSGFCLSIVVIYISYLINKNRIIEYIGKNTMGILIFHKIIILIFQTKLGMVSSLLKNSNIYIELTLGVIVLFSTVLFSLFLTLLFRKVFPFLLGVKK